MSEFRNRNGIKDDWGNWENSAGKEGTDKGYKSVSGQCCGDTHLDIWLQSMDSAGQAQGTNRSYAVEGVKEDRGGFQVGWSEECGYHEHIKAGGSVRYSEKAATELEAKGRAK